MLPSANASGEEQKPRGSWQGEAVEPHHKCPTPLRHICNPSAPGVRRGRRGRGRRAPCCSLSTILLQTWRGFLLLAALVSSSPAVDARSPRKPDSGESRTDRGEGDSNPVDQGTRFLRVPCGLWDFPAALTASAGQLLVRSFVT